MAKLASVEVRGEFGTRRVTFASTQERAEALATIAETLRVWYGASVRESSRGLEVFLAGLGRVTVRKLRAGNRRIEPAPVTAYMADSAQDIAWNSRRIRPDAQTISPGL